jgi:hypothetical protein
MVNRDRGALRAQVRRRYELMAPYLNEQTRRVWAAAEALALGRGGTAVVTDAIGISRTTLTKAKQEVVSPIEGPRRQRRPGGGRKMLAETDEGLLAALDALIDPSTRGDPESPLRWTCKSTYHLAEALTDQGHPVSQRTVYRLLEALGYSLQANRKTQEGADHPDRDAQFLFIRGRIAPRGAARAQVPRSAARRVAGSGWAARSRPPLAAASAESEGPKSPIIRRERAAGFGGASVRTAPPLRCHTPILSSGVRRGEAASERASLPHPRRSCYKRCALMVWTSGGGRSNVR